MRTSMRAAVLCTLFLLPAAYAGQPAVQARLPLADAPPPVAAVVRPPVPMARDFAVPVLMYHRIADLTPAEARSPLMRDLTVSPAAFERQVRHLAGNGFTFLWAGEVERAVREGSPLPEKAVAITMDDGYQDNFEQAFPILRRYGARATIFIVTGSVGTPGHLTWDEILAMHREQVGYGSHTVHHYDLPDVPLSVMDSELRGSRQVLEARLSEPIEDIAYPSGRYDDVVVARAQAAGYLAGWKKGGGPVRPGADPFLLPRVRVNGATAMGKFHRRAWSGVYVLAERRLARAERRGRAS